MPSPLDDILKLSDFQQHDARSAGSDDNLLTEDLAAKRFAKRYAGKLLYCHTTGSWFEWTGVGWTPNHVQAVFHKIRELVRELARGQSARTRSKVLKTGFSAGVERFAKSDPMFARTADRFDINPWLLGTPGGTLDLRTGVMRSANPTECISKLTAIAPSDTAECPRWLQFLYEATGGDDQLICFLRQWCGYALTGITREHALLFIYGPGGNGKSVFLNVLTAVLGNYATSAAMDTFTAKMSNSHPTDMAMLRGARLATASETEEGHDWAEAKIKQLTGGDPITARFMRQDFFTFVPAFKLTIVGNHKPMLRNVDEAIRRRLNIVPFVHKPNQIDRHLEEKLQAEFPGILRWMVEGCLDWQLRGLIRPEIVQSATENYLAEQDLMGLWLAEKCDAQPSDQSTWVSSTRLYASWCFYARAAGEQPGTMKAFSQAMQRRGFEAHRVSQARGYYGIRIKLEHSSAG